MKSQTPTLQIELLYLDLKTCDRCRATDQNLEAALALVQREMGSRGVIVRVEHRHITSDADALALGVEISPTIRVNGQDIQLKWGSSTCGTCSDLAGDTVPCRTWLWQGHEHNAAPVEMIVESIVKAVTEPVTSTHDTSPPPKALSEPIRRFFAGPKQGCTANNNIIHEGSDMKTLEIFDPAMCCSTGVCGVDVDPVLVQFAADLKWVAEQGVEVIRYNLGQDPHVFAANPVVLKEIEAGMERLPIIVVDGQIVATGAYLSRAQLALKLGIKQAIDGDSRINIGGNCCNPKSGCC